MPLMEKLVVCNCPAEFVLSILGPLPGNTEMAACMKCGRSDLGDAMVSEDHPHDVQFLGYRRYDLSVEARAWASAWPRYSVVDDTRIYLPAMVRFQTVAELHAAVAAAAAQQTGTALREKLLALGIPSSGPPASLPEQLAGFVEIWNGLQLNDQTPVDQLLDAATRFNGPNRLAADVLARRTDLQQLAVLLLWDPDEQRRYSGRYLVKQFGLTGVDIVVPLRCRLGELDDNKTGEMSRICVLLREMGAAALSVLPDLEAAAIRVKDTDYYTHKDLTELIERMMKCQ
jgi:hypothetical protein